MGSLRIANFSALPRDEVVAALLGFSVVVALGAANGGFFATSWRMGSLALLLGSAAVLLVRERISFSVRECVMLALMAVLAGWIALSAIWSVNPSQSLVESERGLQQQRLDRGSRHSRRNRDRAERGNRAVGHHDARPLGRDRRARFVRAPRRALWRVERELLHRRRRQDLRKRR